jgi:hypothetical protein
MQEYWTYLVLFFVGALICDVCHNIVYVYKFFGENYDSIPCRIVYGFHFLGLMMGFIGLMEAYFVAVKWLGWKSDGAKVDLSYFVAVKVQLMRILGKVKHAMKL